MSWATTKLAAWAAVIGESSPPGPTAVFALLEPGRTAGARTGRGADGFVAAPVLAVEGKGEVGAVDAEAGSVDGDAKGLGPLPSLGISACPLPGLVAQPTIAKMEKLAPQNKPSRTNRLKEDRRDL